MAEKAPKESYEHILERARRMNLDSMKQLGVLSLPELRAADGRPVVVMTPGLVELPRFQDADFVDRLKCHMLLSLDGISKQEYTVVLFATKMKFSLKVFKFLFSEVYSILPRPYKKNIKALYVVHMPDAVKFFQRVVLFMISHKFWKKVHYVPSIASLSEELNSNVDITAFVPKFVIAHEQLHAEKVAHATAIHSAQRQKRRAQQARRNGGGNDVAISAPTPSAVPQEEQQGAIFGQPLQNLDSNQHGVPLFLIQLESLLQRHALGQEGLFRIPPPQDDLMHAQRQLDAGETPAFFAATEMQAEEVNIIGTLYKLFFRRLPVPLIPFDCYDALIAAQASHDNEKIMQAAEAAIVAMPREHRNTLLHLMQFLTLVAVQAQSNKMSMSNLALIFAPSILRSSDLNPMLELSSIKGRVDIVTVIFDNLDRLEQLSVFEDVRRPPL